MFTYDAINPFTAAQMAWQGLLRFVDPRNYTNSGIVTELANGASTQIEVSVARGDRLLWIRFTQRTGIKIKALQPEGYPQRATLLAQVARAEDDEGCIYIVTEGAAENGDRAHQFEITNASGEAASFEWWPVIARVVGGPGAGPGQAPTRSGDCGCKK